MFCYSNDGYSMRAVDHAYVPQDGEVIFADYATVEEKNTAFPLYNSGIPIPTKEQLIASLDSEYQPQFAELSRALGLASLAEDQLGIQAIREDYNTLLGEYNTKRGVING